MTPAGRGSAYLCAGTTLLLLFATINTTGLYSACYGIACAAFGFVTVGLIFDIRR